MAVSMITCKYSLNIEIIFIFRKIYTDFFFTKSQVIGMIASLEKYMHANEKIGQDYVVRMLQKVRLHCLGKFEVFIVSCF